MEIKILIFLNFFDVISTFFDLFRWFFFDVLSFYIMSFLFFAFLCFAVLCFVIDPPMEYTALYQIAAVFNKKNVLWAGRRVLRQSDDLKVK